MATTVTDNEELHRYEIRLDGDLAGFAEYHRRGDVVVFTHTEVDERFRGHGVATDLVRAALDRTRERGFEVEPQCPLVRAFISEHPEYKDLVSDADRKRFHL
jgi:predicted GNAT family acetyltransferase